MHSLVCRLSHAILCDPTDCSPLASSVYGLLQARILEWVPFPCLQGIFPTQGLNPGLPHGRWVLHHLSPRDAWME